MRRVSRLRVRALGADDLYVPVWIDDRGWNDQVLYFAFIDRMSDGDPDVGLPEGATAVGGDYEGGDLRGLVDLLPYLDGNGQMVLSWSNGGPFNLWQANAWLYRPTFRAIPLPTYRVDPPVTGAGLQPRTPIRAIDTRDTGQRVQAGRILKVPLAGKVQMSDAALPFREAPEGKVVITEFVPCDQLEAQLDAAALSGLIGGPAIAGP